jgi:hypothetical protein
MSGSRPANRDLDPPEPVIRIRVAVETRNEDQTLSALLCRDPVFLFAEPASAVTAGFEADGSSYKVLVRV